MQLAEPSPPVGGALEAAPARGFIKRPVTILVLLTALNLLNYLDRFVLSAVLPKLRDALELKNATAGFLATVFLLGYFVSSPIFGALADRGVRRTWLIAGGIFVWSLATIGTGFATGPWSLVLARAFVGVGEASFATIAPTIVDDIAPPGRKGRYLAIFFAFMPIGSALGYILGGAIGRHYGWQNAFFVAGGPGIILALLSLAIAERPSLASGRAGEKARVLSAVSELGKVPLYRIGTFGYCAYTFAIGGFAFWAPTFLFDRYGVPLDAANFKFGIILVFTGAIGSMAGGVLSDRLAARRMRRGAGEDDAIVRAGLDVCAISAGLGGPLAAIGFLAPSANLFFAAMFVCQLALFLSQSPINAVLLRSAPAHLRASAMAVAIFAIHMFGDLWTGPLVGALADRIKMEWAMMPLPLAIIIGAGIWGSARFSRSANPNGVAPRG